jgi:hypothetical protein
LPAASRTVRLAATLAVLAASAALPASAQFQDRTEGSGLSPGKMTWGAVLGDFDGDGDVDVISGHHYLVPVLLWNNGMAEFSAATHPQPWAGLLDRHGALGLSLDTDRDLEIFVTHGADGGAGSEPNELYRNDGGGSLRSLLSAGGMSDPQGRARSASAADFNGDRRVDVWTAEAPDAVSRNSLFRNNGNLSFTDVAATAGLNESLGTVGGIWGDVDDDGDPDLLVGGEEFSRPTKLWRNDAGVFADASAVFSPPLPVVSGADWGDWDDDGDLDLAVTEGDLGLFDTWAEGDSVTYWFNSRFADAGLDGLTIPSAADTLWGRFRIRAIDDPARIFLGPAGVHPTPSLVIPLTDAYVGAPSFTPGVSRGTWVWRTAPGGPWEVRCSTPQVNFDTFDGFLFETSPILGTTPVDLEDPGFTPGGPRVWRNDAGQFQEITAELGLALMTNPRDVSWVDYDNDGDLDLHVLDMGTSAAPNAPDRLWRNDGIGSPFSDVTAEEQIEGGSSGLGDGAAWGDLDGDLDLDVVVQEGAGPAAFGEFATTRLLMNKGERGHALLLDLVGRQSGGAAIGTRVTVVAGTRRIHRRVQANSWRGFQDPRDVHVGLGTATVADTILVAWPAGSVQTFLQVPAGAWRFEEGIAITSSPELPLSRSGWRWADVLPQPARGAQRLVLETASAMSLDVVVQDLAGRTVRALHRGPFAAGRTSLVWDGRDADGRPVAAGVYWIRATDGRRVEAVKAVRVR